MKGILILYFATGEESRPQFIGDSSLDENGRITNYDEVYDIKKDDEIQIISGIPECRFTVNKDSYTFLHYLTFVFTSNDAPKLVVEYKPGDKNKSWGQIANSNSRQ